MFKNQEFSKEPLKPNTPYLEVVGSLLYIATHARPDVAYAVHLLAESMSQPNEGSWSLAKQVVKYLLSTKTYSLKFNRGVSKYQLQFFTDSDWASDIETRRSVAGFLFCIDSRPISWYRRKQPLVTQSSAEAELVAGAMALREMLCIKRLLLEFKLIKESEALILCCDNQTMIRMVESPITEHHKTKFLDVRFLQIQ